MTPEIYTIIAAAIMLAGLILNGQRAVTELRKDMGDFRREVRGEMSDHRTELNALCAQIIQEIAVLREQINHDIAALSERVARLEGLLEGLRDAITGKAA